MASFNLALRRMAAWGVPTIGVVLLCFLFWDSLWEHDERIRNLALVAAATFGLPIAMWRSYTAHRQAATAQNSLLDERYQRAAEMLGGELAVRLAGIHALARMAQRHLSHHVLIMSALSAVVRTSANRKPSADKKQAPEDVTVIMEVLAARDAEQLSEESAEDYRLDLRATDLRGLSVNEVKLPKAILDDAILSDSDNQAVFWDTDFQGASLISASLVAAYFLAADFSSTNLSNASLASTTMLDRTDFREATLTGADFSNATFGEVDIEDAIRKETNLFASIDLSSASLTDFRRATLTGANFANAKFSEVDIEGAILTGTNLTNVTGLTQQQLNSTQIDLSHPPILTGAIDPETGKPLIVPS